MSSTTRTLEQPPGVDVQRMRTVAVHTTPREGLHGTGLLRLAIFFATVVVAFYATDWFLRTGLRRVDTGVFGVFNRIVRGDINANVLISGSSRALNHYDPRVITRRTGASAWNIGVNGSQTDLQLAVLRTYLEHNRPPSLLIHNLDSFTFVTSKDGIAFPEVYVPYLNERPLYDALSELDPTWWRARHLPLYGFAVQDLRFGWLLGARAWFGRQPEETRFNGFEPRYTTWNEDFDRFRHANPNGVNFQIEQEGIDDLKQLVREIAGRGGRVVLAYSPVYYEMQALERGRAELFALFQDIATRTGALLWDFSSSPITRRRELFYNSQHLNAEGAATFSSDLAGRIAAFPGPLATR